MADLKQSQDLADLKMSQNLADLKPSQRTRLGLSHNLIPDEEAPSHSNGCSHKDMPMRTLCLTKVAAIRTTRP